MSEKKEKLKVLAENFNNAIFKVKKAELLPMQMSRYPRGCCGDVAILLGTYLVENGYTDVAYICGTKICEETHSEESHAWLTSNGLIIDITFSQFEEIVEEITVTEKSSWHDLWVQEIQEITNVVENQDPLSDTYRVILKAIS